MKNDMTIAEKFDIVMSVLANNDLTENDGFDMIAFLEDRKTMATKKSTKTEKPENEGIRNAIVECISDGRKYRLSDITRNVNNATGSDYSPNKVSAQITKLKNDGVIKRTEDKKIAYFSLA